MMTCPPARASRRIRFSAAALATEHAPRRVAYWGSGRAQIDAGRYWPGRGARQRQQRPCRDPLLKDPEPDAVGQTVTEQVRAKNRHAVVPVWRVAEPVAPCGCSRRSRLLEDRFGRPKCEMRASKIRASPDTSRGRTMPAATLRGASFTGAAHAARRASGDEARLPRCWFI